MYSKPYHDPVTGWSFNLLLEKGDKIPSGGIALTDIRHAQHNFAKDVRLVGVWVDIIEHTGKSKKATSKHLPLDPVFFELKNQIVEIRNTAVAGRTLFGKTFPNLKLSKHLIQFDEYFKNSKGMPAGYGLAASFSSTSKVFEDFTNCDCSSLTIEQVFLFSPYSSLPPHEQSGGLNAARFHPICTYSLLPNTKLDEKKKLDEKLNWTEIVAIRFDYRFHLNIDKHHDVAINRKIKQTGNQAALIADRESFGAALAHGVIKAKTDYNLSYIAATQEGFAAVEKPLLKEILAPAVVRGRNSYIWYNRVVRKCWDNLHWWGARGKEREATLLMAAIPAPMISTPGAFHAVHLHWRWGASTKYLPVGSLIPIFGKENIGNKRQFRGYKQFGNVWGPLVDPKLWCQTIQVAIVKFTPDLSPSGNKPLTAEIWHSIFMASPNQQSMSVNIPDELNRFDGDDIVLWYTTKVHRRPKQNAEAAYGDGGSVFINGMYFAHEQEQTSAFAYGSRGPLHWPREEISIPNITKWFRSADEQAPYDSPGLD